MILSSLVLESKKDLNFVKEFQEMTFANCSQSIHVNNFKKYLLITLLQFSILS